MTDRELMQMVLEELEELADVNYGSKTVLQALRDRLAQPEPSHLQFSGSMHVVCKCERCLAQSELKREWVGLTDEEYALAYQQAWDEVGTIPALWKAIEAKLKEKNT